MRLSRVGNIWDGIEALAAVQQVGTITEAATRLRLTQSAVSKRLSALERHVGLSITERQGRRVSITPEGIDLLERARPLLAGLRELRSPVTRRRISTLSVALSDSIAASWGPRVLADALETVPAVRVELHAHRTALLVEAVRLGRYHVGFSTGASTGADLVEHAVTEEPMVLLHAGLSARARADAPLITIEPRSATWRIVLPLLRRHHPSLLTRSLTPVESFSAAVQMVRAGFGDGLVPLGLAVELGLARGSYRALPGVSRRVSLLTRKSVHQERAFTELRDALVRATARYFEA
jgi:DNA-binding transcriptional LysR family regulator